MSSTRTADPDSEFRPERYCSSREFTRGLPANLVARRCGLITDRSERDLIWFIQRMSHEEGGLKRFGRDMVSRFPGRFGTREMVAIGKSAGMVYSPDEVRRVRYSLPMEYRTRFLLKGEVDDRMLFAGADVVWEEEEKAATRPTEIPVQTFMDFCERDLELVLREWCLNPEESFDDGGPWFFVRLKETLSEYMAQWSGERTGNLVTTSLGRRVDETLDYALSERCMVIIDGRERMGKTVAARTWCDRHPGRCRMVEVPSTNDEASFYRAIAKGLGIGAGQSLKGGQVRQKVEDTLQGGDLLLVLDEAHYLWPQQARIRDALPRRLNWIMTALVNHGVSVALITTPQFLKTQRVVEKATHWTSGQFIGRISHYETLPETLTEADLAAVARRLFPEGDESAITGLVCYARTSSKYLAGIEQIVKRARFLARRDGRVQASALDVASALESSVIPSDTALAHALGVAPQCHVTASRRLPARRLQSRGRVTAECPSGRRVETVAAAELAPV